MLEELLRKIILCFIVECKQAKKFVWTSSVVLTLNLDLTA